MVSTTYGTTLYFLQISNGICQEKKYNWSTVLGQSQAPELRTVNDNALVTISSTEIEWSTALDWWSRALQWTRTLTSSRILNLSKTFDNDWKCIEYSNWLKTECSNKAECQSSSGWIMYAVVCQRRECSRYREKTVIIVTVLTSCLGTKEQFDQRRSREIERVLTYLMIEWDNRMGYDIVLTQHDSLLVHVETKFDQGSYSFVCLIYRSQVAFLTHCHCSHNTS